ASLGRVFERSAVRRQELYAHFLECAPGDTAGLRPMARHEQVEALRDAAHRSEFELGAAVAQIADDAVEPGPAAVVDDGCNDHRVAARLQPLFSPSKHQGPDPEMTTLPQSAIRFAKVPRCRPAFERILRAGINP